VGIAESRDEGRQVETDSGGPKPVGGGGVGCRFEPKGLTQRRTWPLLGEAQALSGKTDVTGQKKGHLRSAEKKKKEKKKTGGLQASKAWTDHGGKGRK